MTPRDYMNLAEKLKTATTSGKIQYVVSVHDVRSGLPITNMNCDNRFETSSAFQAIEKARFYHSEYIHATDVEVVLSANMGNGHTIYTHGADRVISILTHLHEMEHVLIQMVIDIFESDIDGDEEDAVLPDPPAQKDEVDYKAYFIQSKLEEVARHVSKPLAEDIQQVLKAIRS